MKKSQLRRSLVIGTVSLTMSVACGTATQAQPAQPLAQIKPASAHQNNAKQNNAKQNNAKQNNAKQNNAKRNNAILERGASPFEDLTEFALRNDERGVTKVLAKIKKRSKATLAALNPSGRRAFERVRSSLGAAHDSKNYAAIALRAVEGYRILVDGFDDTALAVPQAVSFLDYCGFRMTVLVSSATPDWPSIQATADEARGHWRSIKRRIRDHALKDAMETAVEGMGTAAQNHDLRMAGFSAQVDLDLVDLVEAYFERASERP